MKKVLILILLNLTVFASTKIVTGEKTGNYFKVGKNINKNVFSNKAKVLKSSGSVQNMLMVASKEADIALVQADVLPLLDVFYLKEQKSYLDLVDIVGKIYTETLHVVVHKKSDINSLKDLSGKIISYGGKKSGSSVTATNIEQSLKLSYHSVYNGSIKESLEKLNQRKIDALFYVTKSNSKLIKKYKNLKVLSIKENLEQISVLKKQILKKRMYPNQKDDITTYSVDTLVVVKKDFKQKEKLKKYLKTIKTADIEFKLSKKAKKSNLKFNFDKESLTLFSKRYGNSALVRLNYITKKIAYLDNKKLVKKLYEINNLINSLHFLSDKELWKTNQYWATAFESIGTGYSDAEEIAIIKYMFLVKLGLDPKKFKFLKISKPLTIKDKNYSENIVLAYFSKKNSSPVIFEYSEDKKQIYKYKNEYKYKELELPNKDYMRYIRTNKISKENVDMLLGLCRKK